MILEILKYPHPILSTPTQKVAQFGSDLDALISNMVKTMRAANGLGLAAPQVGKNLRMTVIEYRPEKNEDPTQAIPLMVLVNPKIISRSSKTDIQEEGCLSIPGLEIPIERAKKIKIKMQDQTGKPIRILATGLLARIIQHEIDHLDGVLIIDRANNDDAPNKKELIKDYLRINNL